MAHTTEDKVVKSFNERTEGLTGRLSMKNAGGPSAGKTTKGPKATTKTIDNYVARSSVTDDAEAAKLNAKIQADAQMRFGARTIGGKFRKTRIEGK